MKAVFKDPNGQTSYNDAAELLVAELRERRKRLQQLIRLVNEAAGRDLEMQEGVRESKRSARSMPRHKCRNASHSARLAGAA